MPESPVTDFIESTATLLTETAAQLATYAGWTVGTYSGTSRDRLFAEIAELTPPAAVVFYQGSSYGNRPRRTARIGVMVLVDDSQREEGAVSARTLLDQAVALLDRHIKNEAAWFVRGDAAVDVSPTVSCYLVEFEVEDH
jgi:hypothetical protein